MADTPENKEQQKDAFRQRVRHYADMLNPLFDATLHNEHDWIGLLQNLGVLPTPLPTDAQLRAVENGKSVLHRSES
jgi:hypothetical protein